MTILNEDSGWFTERDLLIGELWIDKAGQIRIGSVARFGLAFGK